MPSAKKEESPFQFVIYFLIVFILAISAFSLKNYLSPTKVLGASLKNSLSQEELVFWNEFLANNPNYIPGWIEIGKFEKVKEIDPNYIIEISN